MPTTNSRADYYKITAEGGDKGLFGEKVQSICDDLTEQERETKFGNTSLNITLHASGEDGFLRGEIFQSRGVAPTKRKQGVTTTSPVDLELDEGIDEPTYFVYCPDTSLIAIAYNYHGPKIGLVVYLVNKLSKKVDSSSRRSSYSIIQAGDAIDEVLRREVVRGVTARMKDPAANPEVDEDLDFPAVFDKFTPPKNTKIQVSITSKTRGGVAMKIDEFKKLILPNKNDVELYDVLKVDVSDDETGNLKTYDLIKDKLQEKFRVKLLDGTSEIEASDMFTKLVDLAKGVKDKYDY